MQILRATSTAALILLFRTIVPVYAQEKHPQEQQHAQSAQPKQQQAQTKEQQPKQQRAQTKEQQPKQQRAQTKEQQPKQQRAQTKEHQPKQQRAQTKKQEPKQQRAQTKQPASQKQQAETSQQTKQPQQPQRTEQQAVAWQQQRGWAKNGAWQGHSSLQQDRVQNWAGQHRTWAQRGGYGGYYIPQARFDLSFGSGHWFRMGAPTIYMGYPRFSYGGFSFMLLDPWPDSWAENWYSIDDVYIAYDDGYYLYNRRYPGVGLALTVVM